MNRFWVEERMAQVLFPIAVNDATRAYFLLEEARQLRDELALALGQLRDLRRGVPPPSRPL